MDTGQISRGQLATIALRRFVAGFIILVAVFMASAGTFAYWQAWVYIAVIFILMSVVFAYLLRHDPRLLERRMRTKEHAAEQSLIVRLGSVSYLLVYVLPGLDRRFGWSDVPIAAVIAADLIFLLGYGLFVLVLRENSFAFRVVEVERDQHVITSGPYAVVRHPMYVSVLVMMFSTPVALGSWWAVIPSLSITAVLVARILHEERMLAEKLAGYKEYLQTTRYRLVPGVW